MAIERAKWRFDIGLFVTGFLMFAYSASKAFAGVDYFFTTISAAFGASAMWDNSGFALWTNSHCGSFESEV